MNPFNRGDIVATIPSMATQRNGMIVEHIACYGATAKGGKTCSYKTCPHTSNNDYCWVREPINGSLLSYIYGELMLDPAYNGTVKVASPTARHPTQVSASNPKDDLAVPVDKLAPGADAIVDAFQKSVKEIHINRDKAMAIPNDKIDWEAYNGFGPDKTKPKTYRKP